MYIVFEPFASRLLSYQQLFNSRTIVVYIVGINYSSFLKLIALPLACIQGSIWGIFWREKDYYPLAGTLDTFWNMENNA